MSGGRMALVVALGVLGLVVAIAIGLAASSISSAPIGLSARPLSTADPLAPAQARSDQRSAERRALSLRRRRARAVRERRARAARRRRERERGEDRPRTAPIPAPSVAPPTDDRGGEDRGRDDNSGRGSSGSGRSGDDD